MGAGFPALSAVAGVLGARGGAEICVSIIQAVMIYVVYEHRSGDLENLAVHLNDDSLSTSVLAYISHGVKCAGAPDDVPFVFCEPVVILRIDYGVFALCQRYPAECVVVTQPAIPEHRGD